MSHTLEQALGDRIRATRLELGLTLRDVERLSGGSLTSVAIGSYERADRTMSVTKFLALADFYGVAVTDLLPSHDTAPAWKPKPVTIDLARVADLPVYRREPLIRLPRLAGRHMSGQFDLDAVDVRSLSRTYGVDPQDLEPLLDSWGIVAHPVTTLRRSRSDPRSDLTRGGAGRINPRATAVAYQPDEQGVAL